MSEINYEDFNEFAEVLYKAIDSGKKHQKISKQAEMKLGFIVDEVTHTCSILKIPNYVSGNLFDLPRFLKLLENTNE